MLLEFQLLLENSAAGGSRDETEERWRGVEWASAEFRMGLEPDEIGMVLEQKAQGETRETMRRITASSSYARDQVQD